MSRESTAYHDGIAAGVSRSPLVIPDEYFDDPYLSETWLDGHEEGLIRDHHYCKQLEFEYE